MSVDKNSNISNQPTFDIYVNSLPKEIQEKDLWELFLNFGEIAGILCRYKVGDYGYAIVKFKHRHDAERFLEERNKVSINGHFMEVKCAKRSLNHDKQFNSIKSKSCFLPIPKVSLTLNEVPRDTGHSYLPKDLSFQHGSFAGKQNASHFTGMIEVLCTNVENAVTFYGCPVFRIKELHNLSIQLNDICSKLPRLKKRAEMNKMYAALFLEDVSWYRCYVFHRGIPFKPGMCTVYYIDYGNHEDVHLHNMVELPDIMQAIQPFSTKYIFSNLECNLQLKSQCEITYLHHLVERRMSLYGYASENQEYQVMRCVCNGIDVISEIVKKGFAVYKTQRSDVMTPSFKAGKPKEKNSKKNYKAVESTNLCNGVQKLASSEMTKIKTCLNSGINQSQEKEFSQNVNECVNSIGKSNKASLEGLKKENTDFVPKKIIKRGCELDLIAFIPSHEQKVEKHCLVKVDTVLANLKLINNIRDLVSLTEDDDIINHAANIFFREMNIEFGTKSIDPIEATIKDYMEILTKIKTCCDMSMLPELKSERDSAQEYLISKLKEYLDSFDMSIFEKKSDIQKMIIDLESNSNAWMNIYLDNPPSEVEDLLIEYKKAKERKKKFIYEARKKTNEKHQLFLEFLSVLQKEFCLNLLEEGKEICSEKLDLGCKKISWSVKFEDALSDLGKALEEEIEACTLSRGSSSSSIVQCILDKLDIPKEKIDALCGIYKKYSCLSKDLSNLPNFKPALQMLGAIEDKIKSLNVQLFHYVTSKKLDTQDLLLQLHHVLLEKEKLLETVAKAFELHFPELSIEYPDLMLEDYCNSKYLLKHEWKPDYFPCDQKCSRVESAYMSKFLGEPVVIKEYILKKYSDKKHFIQKVISWNDIKSNFFVKVKAIFPKDETTLCLITNPVWKTLSDVPCTPFLAENENTVQILQQVLHGLKDIHSRQMVHGAIHPLSVLFDKGNILLDICFGPTDSCKTSVKGMRIQPPGETQITESADMYSFGCLVLWVLFPNLSFATTTQGVPNLSAFRSIVEELLSAKDYNLLSAVLQANADERPSSSMLLSSGFLKEYGANRQYCK